MTSIPRATLTEPQARRYNQLLGQTCEGRHGAHPERSHPYDRP